MKKKTKKQHGGAGRLYQSGVDPAADHGAVGVLLPARGGDHVHAPGRAGRAARRRAFAGDGGFGAGGGGVGFRAQLAARAGQTGADADSISRKPQSTQRRFEKTERIGCRMGQKLRHPAFFVRLQKITG